MPRRPPHRPVPPLPFLLGEASEEAREDEEDTPVGPPDAEAAPGAAPLSGTIVGDYRLVTRLAVGGMAEVWLADALAGPRAGRTVAVKRLLPALRADAPSVARFREEARIGGLLDHPNIARTLRLQESAPELFIVQELVGGETVGQLSTAARAVGERLAPAAAVHAVLGLLAALEYLHEAGGKGRDAGRLAPLVHGDVNPDNLLARADGAVKLIDLGLAEPLRPDGTAGAGDGALRGTPAYMAPEQVKARPLTVRSDLFSAGIVLWELLANRPLFAAATEFETLRRVREMPAPPLRAVWREAPTVLERLCVRALAKDPAHRFGSARELAQALREAGQREGLRDGAEALGAEVQRLASRAVQED